MKRWDYRTCPNCGANLDVGERCDCEQAASEAGEEAEDEHKDHTEGSSAAGLDAEGRNL